MSDIGQRLLKGLKEFTTDLKAGKVMEKYRVTKLVRLPDGTIKRIVHDPKK